MLRRVTYLFLRGSWDLRAIYLGLLALMMAGAVVIAGVEQMPIEEAVYFALVTGLTIGYGDIVPMTTFGRIISVVLGFIGVLYTGLVVALAVHAVKEAWTETQKPD